MYRLLSILLGVLFIALGTLGFDSGGFLFGIFAANFSINALYIAIGSGILVAVGAGEESLKLFLRLVSILLILFAAAGLWYFNQNLFTLFANNFSRALLNSGLAAASFWLGFLFDKK